MMTTNRKLTIGIIALLTLNLIILGVLFINHKKNHRTQDKRQGPGHVIIKKLDFNEEQIASFKNLKKEHREHVKAKDTQIRAIKNKIFKSLGNEGETNIDSLTTVIGGLQKDIEMAHYNHLLKIKSLCKGDQIDKFDELSKELSKIFDRGKRRTTQKNK